MSGTGEGVLGRAISGGRWAVFGLGVQKAVGFVSFFILARLLAPEDYGVITVVLMLVGVLETLSSPGFERALTQRKGEIGIYLDVFWTFNFFRALGTAGVIFLLAPWAASFFEIRDSSALLVLRLSGFLVLISALGNLGSLFFFKELEFKNLFWRDLAGQIAFSAAAISWAFFHPSVFALFFGYAARNAAAVFIQYFLHPHRPRFSFYFSRLRDLASFGFWAMGQNVLNQANSIVETAVIGRFLGVRDLGFYSRANNLAALPSSAIFSVIYKVGFPAYAKIQESREKITEGFLKSWELALLTLLPFAALIFFEAGELVRILLGEKWLGMVGAMKILALAVTFEGFLHLVWPVSEGVGRPDVRFKFGALQIIMALPLLIFLSLHYGLLGAAWAMLIAFLATALPAGFWVFSYLKPGVRRVLRPVGAVMGATAASALAGAVLKFWLAPLSLPTLILWLFLIGLAYLLALKFFSRFWGGGPYETLRLIFKF